MTDNRPLLAVSAPLADAYADKMWWDDCIKAARKLREVALLNIAARLFWIWACANRISFIQSASVVRVVPPDAYGPSRDYAERVASQANLVDTLTEFAFAASVIAFLLYWATLYSQRKRRRRGEDLAVAINKNRAVRFSTYLYLLVAITSGTLTYAFNPGPDASPDDRLHALLHLDTANIAIQTAMIASLLLIALGTGREIHNTRARNRIN